MVKLKIEMSMAELIAKVATSPHIPSHLVPSASKSSSANERKDSYVITQHQTNELDSKLTKTFDTSKNVNWSVNTDRALDRIFGRSKGYDHDITLNMRREVHVLVERRNSLAPSFKHYSSASSEVEMDDDLKPLKPEESGNGNGRGKGKRVVDTSLTGMDRYMGVSTKVWAPAALSQETQNLSVSQ
jgi:hypothetical protein